MNEEQTLRDQIIENDLGWVKELSITQIGDQIMLGGDPDELPFNISWVMEEKDFVREWLLAFVVGTGVGVNYFNQSKWFQHTMGGSRAVMLVNKDEATGKFAPVLVIPPLLSINFTHADRLKLRQAAGMMYANGHDANKKHDLTSNLRVASALGNADFGLEAKPMEMSDLLPPSFLEKYDMVPYIEQVIYWTRDKLRKKEHRVETNPEDLNRMRKILFRKHKGEKPTKEEQLFLYKFTFGNYEPEDDLDTEADTSEQSLAAPSNRPSSPFDC